jgi:hypothetical protein
MSRISVVTSAIVVTFICDRAVPDFLIPGCDSASVSFLPKSGAGSKSDSRFHVFRHRLLLDRHHFHILPRLLCKPLPLGGAQPVLVGGARLWVDLLVKLEDVRLEECGIADVTAMCHDSTV